MKRNIALWDRLAGTIVTYIQERIRIGYSKHDEWIAAEQFKPFGETLGNNNAGIYEINMDTIDIIMDANDINELSPEIQKIVLWHLPRFLEVWPEYKDAECLKIKE